MRPWPPKCDKWPTTAWDSGRARRDSGFTGVHGAPVGFGGACAGHIRESWLEKRVDRAL